MAFKGLARFQKPGNRFVTVNAWKKVLTVSADQHHSVRDRHPWADRAGARPFVKDAELKDAFVAICEEAEADGWSEYGPKDTWRQRVAGTAPKRPSQRAAEERLDTISDTLAAALAAANGDPAAEALAIGAAAAAFGDLNEQLDNNRFDHAMHFFAVDGVGLKKKRVPALRRLDVDDVTAARWLALLELAAR